MPDWDSISKPGDWADKEPGDLLQFGRYLIDEDTMAPITWRVLDKEDERLLVISEYALDCRPYHGKETKVSWESCDLRKWLNGAFLDAAFDTEEQALIPEVTVVAERNPAYPEVSPGEDTEDRVFLLSLQEAERYFRGDEARKCLPTAYALAREAFTWEEAAVDGKAPCWWWLRSPGRSADAAVHVNAYGVISAAGDSVDNLLTAIRPALWINPPDAVIKSEAVQLSGKIRVQLHF